MTPAERNCSPSSYRVAARAVTRYLARTRGRGQDADVAASVAVQDVLRELRAVRQDQPTDTASEPVAAEQAATSAIERYRGLAGQGLSDFRARNHTITAYQRDPGDIDLDPGLPIARVPHPDEPTPDTPPADATSGAPAPIDGAAAAVAGAQAALRAASGTTQARVTDRRPAVTDARDRDDEVSL